MLGEQECANLIRANSAGVDYILRKAKDEERRANEVRTQELLATAENPRIRFQDETADICKELYEIKRQEILIEKRRQRLRANSHELRLLNTQIRSARVAQEVLEQKRLVQDKGDNEAQLKQEENRKWAIECEKAKQFLAKEEEQARQKKINFRIELQQQMDEINKRRILNNEKCLKDQKEMQEKLKRLAMEEKNEKLYLRRMKEKCKDEMNAFLREKALYEEMEKLKYPDCTSAHLAYFRERDELKERMEKERKRLQEERQALSERIGKQLQELNEERTQREDLLLTLLVGERKAKEDARYRQYLEKRNLERMQLRTELEHYCEEVKPQNAAFAKQKEHILDKYQNDYLLERDNKAKLLEEEKRKRTMEHSRQILQMIEERQRQRTIEAAERIKEYKQLLAMQQEEDRQIQEERLHMLRSLPRELLRYLPPGALRPADRELL